MAENLLKMWQRLGLKILDQTQRENGNFPRQKPKPLFVPNRIRIDKMLASVKSEYSQICGVTFTFKSKWIEDDHDYDLHKWVATKIKESRVWKGKKFILFPEFSKKNGNLHYHGIIYGEYQSEVVRCVKWWRRTFGFAKPELELKNIDNWFRYITKDYGKTGLWTLSNQLCY